MFYADAMGFINNQMAPPVAHPDLPQYLSLLHTTAAPPIPSQFGKTEQILKEVKKFRATLDEQKHLTTVLSRADLESIRVGEQTGVVLGLQMAPYDISYDNLQRLHDAGIRVIGTSYQGEPGKDDHPLGGGFLAPEKGLTPLGHEFLTWCKELGMTVDVAHAGHRTAYDIVLENPGAWLMASHSGVYEVYQNPRNLSGRVLERIAASEGFIGAYSLTFGLSHSSDRVLEMAFHLMHMVLVCGSHNVGIGSDGVYQELNLQEWRTQVEKMRPKFDPHGVIGVRWPDQPLEINSPNKLRTIASSIMVLQDYPNMLGENLRQFFLRSLPV